MVDGCLQCVLAGAAARQPSVASSMKALTRLSRAPPQDLPKGLPASEVSVPTEGFGEDIASRLVDEEQRNLTEKSK